MSDAEILAIGKQVAQCFRDSGMPGVPDPIVDKGRLKFPDGVEEQLESQYSEQVQEQAMQACQSIMDRLPESAIRGEGDEGADEERQGPGPGDVDALRDFSKCMRENGIPEWPDPKADGSYPLAGSPIETEGKSPRVLAGFEACRKHWAGGFKFS